MNKQYPLGVCGLQPFTKALKKLRTLSGIQKRKAFQLVRGAVQAALPLGSCPGAHLNIKTLEWNLWKHCRRVTAQTQEIWSKSCFLQQAMFPF